MCLFFVLVSNAQRFAHLCLPSAGIKGVVQPIMYGFKRGRLRKEPEILLDSYFTTGLVLGTALNVSVSPYTDT